MIYKNSITVTTLILTTFLGLSACSVKTKLYSPPANSQTATLNYSISQDSFFAPYEYIKRDGYTERVDIQFKPSRFAKPKTVFMALDRNVTSHEANSFEANKPLEFTYEHKAVKDLGNWPLMCVVGLRNVILKPGHSYLLQGYTVKSGESTNIKLKKVANLKCQMKILDNSTKEIIADTGLNNQL